MNDKKTIKIKFKLCDSIDNYNYRIKIYDNNNNLLINKYTNLGYINFKVPYYGIYKIKIVNLKHKIEKCIILYINDKSEDEVLFFLNDLSIKKKHLITVKITDQFYKDLPIMKGNVILWQNNT